MNLLKSSKYLLLIPALTAMVACGKGNKAGSVNADGNVNAASLISDKSLTGQQKAQRLAEAAQQLISYQGFVFANDLADLALEQDGTNLQAQFIKALLAPIMAQKGILKRVQPLAAKDAKSLEDYNKEIAKVEQMPNSTIKSFLLDGKEDINSETEVQDYVDSVANGFKTLREFAKNNKNAELKVQLSDTFFEVMKTRHEKACLITESRRYVYDIDCPDMQSFLEVRMNRADMEALQNLAAANELYYSLFNSYDLNGAIETAMNHQGPGPKPSADSIIKELLANQKFGVLRNNNGFQKVSAMGVDAISGIRYVMNNQNSLCVMGESHPRNRMGMLFSYGMCADKKNASQTETNLRQVEAALAGATVKAKFGSRVGVTITTDVKPVALLDAPIRDLRSLTPLEFDLCRKIVGVADKTGGGAFPKGDLNSILSLDKHVCW